MRAKDWWRKRYQTVERIVDVLEVRTAAAVRTTRLSGLVNTLEIGSARTAANRSVSLASSDLTGKALALAGDDSPPDQLLASTLPRQRGLLCRHRLAAAPALC